jgi:phosphoribosylaminoimidazole-succinocarboxamide synthase
MPQLSPARLSVRVLKGLNLIHRGKVRDTYEINDYLLLIVASDGISIFDFVLNALIPLKGYVLTAMSHFWFTFLESKGIKTHMVAAGRDIDRYLPVHLRGDTDLQSRAMVVKRLTMLPTREQIEFIGRNCLTGSVLKEYQESGTVYGVRLPKGLQDGDALDDVLFTPTSKADEGHDEPRDPQTIREENKEVTDLFLRGLKLVSGYARRQGIVLADGKGELGKDTHDEIMFGDEFGTPDSSRFWDFVVWKKSRKEKKRKAPPPYDKQLVRMVGIEFGINKLDPKQLEDVVRVHEMVVPRAVVWATTATYRYIFWRLTKRTLEQYLIETMGVALVRPKRHLAIVVGSESDLPAVEKILHSVGKSGLCDEIELLSVNVISCHRNPDVLNSFAESGCGGADVVIAAGGKALALPGVLDALLYAKGKTIPVVGVALAEKGSRSERAAQISIEELPGEPVILDESTGRAYTGASGFRRALKRIAYEELTPPKSRPSKPAKLMVGLSFG